MKKQLFLFTFFSMVTLSTAFGIDNKNKSLFMGSIQFPEKLTDTDLCVYYKGKKIVTEWDNSSLSSEYSFLESKQLENLYILISENISFETDNDNTIKNLKIEDDRPYLCYKLTASRVIDEGGNPGDLSWNDEIMEIKDGAVPENTIIFLFNPDLIDKVQIHNWKKNQNMRLVPTIKIKKDLTSKELIAAVTIAQLKSVDINLIHEKE